MNKKHHKYLHDIINAIELIEYFLISTTNYFEYQTDLKTKSAVERQLVIIGEAVNKLEKENPNIKLTYSR